VEQVNENVMVQVMGKVDASLKHVKGIEENEL